MTDFDGVRCGGGTYIWILCSDKVGWRFGPLARGHLLLSWCGPTSGKTRAFSCLFVGVSGQWCKGEPPPCLCGALSWDLPVAITSEFAPSWPHCGHVREPFRPFAGYWNLCLDISYLLSFHLGPLCTGRDFRAYLAIIADDGLRSFYFIPTPQSHWMELQSYLFWKKFP